MCSVDSCEIISEEKKINLAGSSCRKCGVVAAKVVLQKKFPYCRDCFLSYVKHKYSSGIGREKLLRPKDRVLLSFSGSYSSLCLLNLIHTSLVEERKKKTIFEVVLLYIDDQICESLEKRQWFGQCLKEMTSGYNYKLLFTRLTPLGEGVVLSDDHSDVLSGDNAPMIAQIDGFTSKTARNDFIDRIRTFILIEAAKKLSCSRIFTGETSDHIATKIISNIAVARGMALASDTGFINRLDEKITLVRPLREISKKEVVFYNIFYNIHRHEFPWIVEGDKFSSIQKLTESFIMELQQSFSSTVQTITSTGGKLASLPVAGSGTCLLCQSSIAEARELSAKEAMKISHLVTTLGEKNLDFPEVNNENGLSQDSGVDHSLCYPCMVLLKENKVPLLGSLAKESSEAHRHNMHKEIQDFLIT